MSDTVPSKRKLASEEAPGAEDIESKKAKNDDAHIRSKVETLEIEQGKNDTQKVDIEDNKDNTDEALQADGSNSTNPELSIENHTDKQAESKEEESVKEKETSKEIANEAANNTANETPKETATEPPKEPSKETPKATFGGTSFTINPSKSTPLHDFGSSFPSTPKSSSSTPSHTFGAATAFGNKPASESLKNKPSIFDTPTSNAPTGTASSGASETSGSAPAPAKSSFGSSFGANSKFANAFQNSLKKKSFLDADSSEANKEKATNDPETKSTDKSSSKSGSATPQQYKQIDLTPVPEIKTGEENEKSLFSVTAKLFELNLTQISEGWKERGLGPLHLNESLDDSTQVRLVMRSQGLLRVILNIKITPDFKLIKGLEASLSPGKFLRINSMSEKGYPVQYLLKFGNENVRNELYDKVEESKKSITK